jgi:hypothetical protein
MIDFILENKDKMTRQALADKVGKSRNAVIGKLWRLDPLSKYANSERKEKEAFKKTENQEIEKKPDNVVKLKIRPSKAGKCQYPTGDKVPYSFCGKDITHGSYCNEHYSICYKRSSASLKRLERKHRFERDKWNF